MKPNRLVVVLLLAGCRAAAPSAGSPPASAAQAWAAAVAANDPDAAWELLSADVKKHASASAFRDAWRQSAAERARQAAAIKVAVEDGGQSGERGRILLGEGKAIALTRETAGWRLEAPLLAATRASTPQEALRQFAAAVDAHNVDAVLRTLSSAGRERLLKAVTSFSSGLKAHLGDPIEVTGEGATLIWSEGKLRWKIILKREDGEWRVHDFNPL